MPVKRGATSVGDHKQPVRHSARTGSTTAAPAPDAINTAVVHVATARKAKVRRATGRRVDSGADCLREDALTPARQVDLDLPRCFGGTNVEYARYHDEEWGIPVHDDRMHFEVLTLEGAQAGLSFETVLKKRDGCVSESL